MVVHVKRHELRRHVCVWLRLWQHVHAPHQARCFRQPGAAVDPAASLVSAPQPAIACPCDPAVCMTMNEDSDVVHDLHTQSSGRMRLSSSGHNENTSMRKYLHLLAHAWAVILEVRPTTRGSLA